MNNNVKKNFIYNIAYQIVTIIMPIITVPYISRVLGKDGVGVNGFTLSIAQYFIIAGTLGMSLYGNRTIAFVRDDKEKLAKSFWTMVTLQITCSVIALIFYMAIFGRDKTYGAIYMIQSINIIAAAIDISWFFMGIEDFKKTVTRNMIVKVLGVICIFLFIKNKGDLNLYILISGMMVLVGQATMWFYIPKAIPFVKIRYNDVIEHLVPALKLFIPQISIQIYVVLDKTMTGIFSTKAEVGLYDQSQKIVKIVLSLVTSIGAVMLPMMTNMFANGEMDKVKIYLNKSITFVSYIAIPMMFGIMGISNEFAPWFFGQEFERAGVLMAVISPILLFIAWSNVLGMQFMLPTGRNKQFTISVTAGAIINFLLNVVLIRKYQSLGSCIATLLAEFAVVFVQYLYVRKYIDMKALLKPLSKYFLSGLVMLFVVRIIGVKLGVSATTTILQAICGGVVYIVLMLLFKDEINNMIAGVITKKLKRQQV